MNTKLTDLVRKKLIEMVETTPDWGWEDLKKIITDKVMSDVCYEQMVYATEGSKFFNAMEGLDYHEGGMAYIGFIGGDYFLKISGDNGIFLCEDKEELINLFGIY